MQTRRSLVALASRVGRGGGADGRGGGSAADSRDAVSSGSSSGRGMGVPLEEEPV